MLPQARCLGHRGMDAGERTKGRRAGRMRHTQGSIEVICGSMFSGKTDELIRRLVRAKIAKQKVQVFKPAIDVRYAVEKVTSHAGADFDAIPVEKAADILGKLDADTTVVGIDEAQFLDDGVVEIATQ